MFYNSYFDLGEFWIANFEEIRGILSQNLWNLASLGSILGKYRGVMISKKMPDIHKIIQSARKSCITILILILANFEF